MNLYFVAHHDENGENQDWFVVAEDRDEAIAEWQAETEIDDEPNQVFLVPAIPNPSLLVQGTRALSWHTEVPVA